MPVFDLVLLFIAVAASLVLLHEIARLGLHLLLSLALRLPPRMKGSRLWVRTHPVRARLKARWPRLYDFVHSRFDPREFTGLPMTLMIAAAVYIVALFGGLVEDVLEAKGVAHFDEAINAFFGPYRVEPLLAIFLWITALGAGPGVVAAAVIATGFLWADRRRDLIPPLWVTLAGAELTTWVGKYLIARHRPQFLAVASAFSPSFPSSHATASMAVYGFLAYAIARVLPLPRDRFEVAFWTFVLILFVGFSRIFLSVHYTTDVASGFLVGGFWLLVGWTLAERHWNTDLVARSSRPRH